MKRFLALVLSLAVLVGCLALPAGAIGYDPSTYYQVQASSAYIVNTDTNIIVYEKNSTEQVYAGGLTKLMCAALSAATAAAIAPMRMALNRFFGMRKFSGFDPLYMGDHSCYTKSQTGPAESAPQNQLQSRRFCTMNKPI